MTHIAQTTALAVLSAIVLLPGCGDGRPDIAPVAGRVLIDGEPLTHGTVHFYPSGSRPSFSKLESDGSFRLTCRDANDGAILGHHLVAVEGTEILSATETMTKVKWHAPKKYADTSTSGLTQEITGPTDSLTINLTWDGQMPFVEVNQESPEAPPHGGGKRAAPNQ